MGDMERELFPPFDPAIVALWFYGCKLTHQSIGDRVWSVRCDRPKLVNLEPPRKPVRILPEGSETKEAL